MMLEEIEPGAVREKILSLKKRGAHFVAITCIDLKGRFALVYHFVYSAPLNVVAELRRGEAIGSIAGIFPSADFHEREIHEMFGVEFIGGSTENVFLFSSTYPMRK